ncbi:MAG TPA: hypothetical protein VGB65_06135 [Allosphingosinicella sp.]|jgi:ZIP family zinc transporter
MPIWLEAALWGLFAGSALLIGASLAYLFQMPPRVTAGIMAFGCGVLACWSPLRCRGAAPKA